VLVAAVGLSVPDAPITDIFALSPEETRERLWHDPAIAAQVPVDTSQAAIGLIRRNRTALARFGQDPLLFDPGLEPRLPAITARTLVIWPASDRIVPRGVAERFAGRIPNATLQVLPEAGHGVQMEQPEALADRIRSFAAGAPVV
jgi:pimeloyl-ACP methyl ester carboxylesterase